MFINTNNPKKTLLLILSFLIIYCQFLIATVRYVSHSGSNTPPYTTWETAADSIMSAINISVFGDTIYVANGVYEEQVIMIPGLSLIGAGMDSCVIDTRNLTFNGFVAVEFADSCLIKHFTILISNSRIGNGIRSENETGLIKNIKIKNGVSGIFSRDNSNTLIDSSILINLNTGINLFNSNSHVSNNIINVDDYGIIIDAFTGDYYPVIEKNIVSATSIGILVQFNSSPTIRNNIIFLNGNFARGYSGGGSDSVWIYNNLIVAENAWIGLANTGFPTIELNNFLIGNFDDHGVEGVIMGADNNIIKNNVVMNAKRGIQGITGNHPVIEFNNSWNNDVNYSGFIPDSTNLSVNPMIVNEDTTQGELDFHLQMFSPLIDAGDPNIIDVDSSRSDIGLYGGPFGESYTYLDLAPRPPVNLTAEVDSNQITFCWNHNTEADFSHYSLFRDTTANFSADSTTFVLSLTDTFYTHLIPVGIDACYYKLTAIDNQGNESNPSEELEVLITSVKEYPTTVSDYRLYQNYPNPFNPATKIGYRLKERGYVKLYVYDIKGELVDVLVNQIQDAGYYEVEFGVKGQTSNVKTQLASGVYIYQIHVLSENNPSKPRPNGIPVFSDIKKMIYLK